MQIVKYLVPLSDKPPEYRYGTPVEVWIHGEPFDLVLQLQLPGQQHAVVHWQSGGVVAPVDGDIVASDPAQIAQAACSRRLQRVSLERFKRTLKQPPVLNVELVPA